MKSIWVAQYQNNEIRIENSWFKGERLFVNDKLQDNQINVFGARLSGHITTNAGNKESVKVSLGGFFKINCFLFIEDEPIEVIQIK